MLVLQETSLLIASETPFSPVKSPTPLQSLDSGTVFRQEVSNFLIRFLLSPFRSNKKRKKPMNRLKTLSMPWKIVSGPSIHPCSIRISQKRKLNKFYMKKILNKSTKFVTPFPLKPPTCTLASKKCPN